MAAMNRDSFGSSVDPEDVGFIGCGDESVSFRTRRASAYSSNSLSAMTDLEDDAVPTSPQSVNPPANWSSYLPAAATPQQNMESTMGTSALHQAASMPPCQNHISTPVTGCKVSADQSVSDTSRQDTELFCSERKQETYDAVIICHPKDKEAVLDLQQKLNELILFDDMPARVAIEDDDASFGMQEIEYFEQWLEKAEIMFLYGTKNFFSDLDCKFKVNVSLVESFFVEYGKKEFVIPVFLENKYKVKYVSPSVRAIRGIDFTGSEWTERMKKKFKDNLNSARGKRKEREVTKGVEDLNLKD